MIVGVQQVLTDHAVLDLTSFSAPLPLHARGLGALFMVTRGIQDTDGLIATMFIDDQLLQSVADPFFIPNEQGQELLQRSNRNTRRQGDRLDALAFQVSHQAGEVPMPVVKSRPADEKRTKSFQQRSQRRLQRSNLIGIHNKNS